MANLRGTKTEKNLMEAFADESVARTKYTFYAEQARKEDYGQIADAFENAANNEKEHAKVWHKLLGGDEPLKTAENLKDAIKGESDEGNERYKRMADEAFAEGFDKIAFLFESVGVIEKEHEQIFKDLLQKLEENSLCTNNEKAFWVCKICGYKTDDENAPDRCPVCEHPKSYFRLQKQ